MKRFLLFLGLLFFQFGDLKAQDSSSYLGDLGVVIVTPARSAGVIADYGTNIDVITKKR